MHQHTEVRPLPSLEWVAFSQRKLPARNVTDYLQKTNSGVVLQLRRTLSYIRKKRGPMRITFLKSGLLDFLTKTCEFSPHFLSNDWTKCKLVPRASRMPCLFLAIACCIDAILSWNFANVFQTWSTLAGYQELARGFWSIREGEYFEWVIISSRFFENEPDKICIDLSEKRPKGRVLRPIRSNITLAKEKEREKERAKGNKGGEEKKKQGLHS